MTQLNQRAKFAPVAPVQILQDLLARGLIGDYHLFLAHHTVEKTHKFESLMSQMILQGSLRYKEVTIIMDNSIVELGGSVDDKMIKEAVEIAQHYSTKFRVIPVLPDVMGKGADTIELASDAYERWNTVDTTHRSWMPGEGYMLVTQGESWEDFVALVNFFFLENRESYQKITWVGVPRVLLKCMPSRTRAIKYIRMVAPHVKIHLLGFSDDICDDMLSASLEGVAGIDSAVPVRYDGLLTPVTTSEEIGKRAEDWMEKGILTQRQVLNIQNVRRWVSGQ